MAHSTVLGQPLQDVPVGVFQALGENDVLFIDSTHVSKVGSDVNRLLFEIFPLLAPGVVIHLHDIFYPFEYPKAWILEGRAWNEAYLVRAFLQDNARFQVLLMNTFMSHFHREFFEQQMPLCLHNEGASLWLRKTA
ncbi:class I SAM-dependent methyltransferase [Variovorax sp. N23]|uniref:class I SAM-dependent methyltransferase n=1 Tax=Variovorax sp. N23 TaxID=2980555 RepID=UPI0021C7955F|nr:class I SAM-dependent methyltransferase [Variovorax sp. N23]MCU4121180.1 class I SAM-dependent methyltransferase [Variovorax sp. N23]